MSTAVKIQITADQLALLAHALMLVDRKKLNFEMRESFFADNVNEELDSLMAMCLETSEDPDPDMLYGFCL